MLGILLTVHKKNPNQKFYSKNGFAPVPEWTPRNATYQIWVCLL